MPLKLFNTLNRKEEVFEPIASGVRMYSCGPTVYNNPHIGNYRAYIFADLLKRTLLYEGYEVKHIMNITDIDDKTILGSQKEGKSLKEFTEFYTDIFLHDVASLNILPPNKFTKATDYINQMVKIIERLLSKGLAYKSNDGSIYFDIKKFKDYGKLSHLDLKNQKENASGRIKTDEYEKDNAQDFALWKAYDEKDGDVYWETTLGKGRPGWHIECSAMSMENLGDEFDIHTGGVDNIFPHHENEIAQSEGASGHRFVKYWVHNEWVLVDQKKMSKSLNNFYVLSDLEKNGYSPISYRFWLLMAHYRTRVNFVWEALEGADKALKRLYATYQGWGEKEGKINENYQNRFREYLQNDLDTPQVIALVFELVKDDHIKDADKKATLLDFDRVLGLGFLNIKKVEIPENIQELAKERELARKNKDFTKSDELRAKINSLGYEVKDSNTGFNIVKL